MAAPMGKLDEAAFDKTIASCSKCEANAFEVNGELAQSHAKTGEDEQRARKDSRESPVSPHEPEQKDERHGAAEQSEADAEHVRNAGPRRRSESTRSRCSNRPPNRANRWFHQS